MRRAVLIAVVAVAACAGSDDAVQPTTTATNSTIPAAVTSTTTTTAPTTTASTTPPPTPRPSAREAVDYLLGAWRAGDRVGALTVAEPAAVDSLFAIPPETPESRGCNEPPPGLGAPTYCVYRLNAGELQVRAAEREGGYIVDLVVLGSG